MAADSVRDTVTAVSSNLVTTGKPEASLSFLQMLMKGGWVMIPIGILSVLALYFTIERFLTIRKASRIDDNFIKSIRDYLINGSYDSLNLILFFNPIVFYFKQTSHFDYCLF